MEVLYKRCCGLDVHKKSITACALTPEGKEIKNFGTMTEDIFALVEWIKEKGCTHVAMESTGVYWKPIYNLLEIEDIEILVVNAQHIKMVPGRKTDVKDAEWIADLLRHGLLKGSYIPDRDQRELRELVRYRKSMIGERSREVNRMQKVLEGCNIKLSSVATDITGVSAKSMLKAIIDGAEDTTVVAKLAKGRMKNKQKQLEKALAGLIGEHQKKLLLTQIEHIEFMDQKIKDLDQEIEMRMHPFEEELALLETIPGVARRSAEEIGAEIGFDMDRFPTDAHISSWAGMSPGNNESAGKRKSGKTTKGNKSLRTTLVISARSASRTKNTYLSAQYRRIASRRGGNRAAVAVGHSMLVIAYHILKKREPYKELGADYFDQRKKDVVVNGAIKRLKALGYKVTVEAESAA